MRFSPPCHDGAGYSISVEDLEFLRIDPDNLADMLARVRPLGMTLDQYTEVKSGLEEALRNDGITDADVRLQGSSAHLWSGWHKSMPFERHELLDLLAASARFNGNFPASSDVDVPHELLTHHWAPGSPRPVRRPFDVMYRIRVDEDPATTTFRSRAIR